MANDGYVTLLHEVAERPLPLSRLAPVIGQERYDRLVTVGSLFKDRLGGRTIWNVNSTAVGGGVAEMLQVIVGYVAGIDIAIRWITVGGDPAFFAITKRLHNQIHGANGEVPPLDSADARHYEQVLAANADELLTRVRSGDVAILHDPQTAGLTPALTRAGVRVLWRCHIGIDEQNDISRAAWEFLRPYLAAAHGFVFTRTQFAPLWVPRARTWVIPPSIDPFSPKNADLDAQTVRAILEAAGVVEDGGGAPPAFVRHCGDPGTVVNRAEMVELAPVPADARLVVQVSRWDRLKDPSGVLRGFADHVAAAADAHLVLAGPAVEAVADDPEGVQVLQECVDEWRGLPDAARSRIHLACLPMADSEENAAIVNALQRRADVVVQKSLAEGFGLTVAEAMWKARPVVASRIGGIQDQIEHRRTGLLLADPLDLAAYGGLVLELLRSPERSAAMGVRARETVRAQFLGPHPLMRYAQLLSTLLDA